MKNKIDSKSFGLIRRYLKGLYHLFVLALLCSVLNTVFSSLTPQIFRFAVDGILGGDGSSLPDAVRWIMDLEVISENPGVALGWTAVAAIIAAAISGFCSYGFRMNTTKASEGFVKSLRDSLYAHIQKLPFSWHTAHQTGEIIQRCTSDVEVVRNFVTNQLIEVIRIVFLIVFSLTIMFSMNVKMALIAAV
ncbi:MAG: ABC transporter ATP-binding protein, partial [Oscillospiraceae bacterium]|nr:ABC transporter ATP-binding protein [Oscillospiraceae bacterium]